MLRWCDACMGIMGIMGIIGIMRVMLVRHDIPRGFALPLGGDGSGDDVPLWYAGSLMAAGECVLRWCDACMGIMGIMGIIGIMRVMLVRHDIPRGFAMPQGGMARAQMYRWVEPPAD